MEVGTVIEVDNLRATYLGEDYQTSDPSTYPNLFLQAAQGNVGKFKNHPFMIQWTEEINKKINVLPNREDLIEAIYAGPGKAMFSAKDHRLNKYRLQRTSLIQPAGFPKRDAVAQVRNATSSVAFRMMYSAGLNVEAFRKEEIAPFHSGRNLHDSVTGTVQFNGDTYLFMIRHNHPAVTLAKYFKDPSVFAQTLSRDFAELFVHLGLTAEFHFADDAFAM